MSSHFFAFSFFVSPALLLGILFLGARIQKIILWSWAWTLSPFYLVLFASLALIIVEYKHRSFLGDATGARGMLIVNFFVWIFIFVFLYLLPSKLDNMKNSFPWTIVFSPLIAVTAISATFEFTGLCVDPMTHYSILFRRNGKIHFVIWTLIYISLLLFFAVLSQKLDALPLGAPWCPIFIPMDFFLFFFFLAIIFVKFGQKNEQGAPGNLTLWASSAFLLAMLIFTIIIQSALCVKKKIDAFAILSPFIIAFGLITCATVYFKKKYKPTEGGGEEGAPILDDDNV